MNNPSEVIAGETLGEKVLQFNSPIVAKMAEMYRGLSRQGKLGFVAVFLILWHRFGGKILIKNGKIVHFVPSCKYIVFKRGGILLTLFKNKQQSSMSSLQMRFLQ